jgi:hypothetical protein
MPNEWNTFIQQHTTPSIIALNNRMKELNKKTKSRHKLGHDGYKVAMPIWRKKEKELREDGIPDPIEGCTVRTKN